MAPNRALFQHRHFAWIAAAIAALPDNDMDRAEVAVHFALMLADTNTQFDQDRFLLAALGQPQKKDKVS